MSKVFQEKTINKQGKHYKIKKK